MEAKRCEPMHIHCRREIGGREVSAIFPVYCNSWDCERCRSRKQRTVRHFIQHKFKNSQLYMITITFHRQLTASETWAELGACWNRLRTAITKVIPKFTYIRIVEPHKRGGYPHMHILTPDYIPARVLSKRITDAGFGFVFNRKRMSHQGACQYVAKYLSKEWISPEATEYRKESGARIVQASQDLGPVFRRGHDWEGVELYTDCRPRSLIVEEIAESLYRSGHRHIEYQEEEHVSYLISDPPSLKTGDTVYQALLDWGFLDEYLTAKGVSSTIC